jgi:ABC-type multidrug transport system fused ATPase/permease subunit
MVSPNVSIPSDELGHLITVRKRWFQFGPWILVVPLLSIVLAATCWHISMFVTYAPDDLSLTLLGIFVFIPLIVFLWIFASIFIHFARGMTIKLFTDRVQEFYGSSLHQEITFDCMVLANTIHEDDKPRREVRGYSFIKGNQKVEMDNLNSWRDEDVEAFWRPFITVLMQNEMRAGEDLALYIKNKHVPSGKPIESLAKAGPKKTRDRSVNSWELASRQGADETLRAEVLTEGAISGKLDADNLHWHNSERFHPFATLSTVIMIIGMVLFCIMDAMYDSKGILGALLVIAIGAVILYPIIMFGVRSTRFATRYYLASVEMPPRTTFMTLVGVLRAHGIEHTLNTDGDTMPSKIWGMPHRRVSIEFKFQGHPYSIDISGESKTWLWFGPKPELDDGGFWCLLEHTSFALTKEEKGEQDS